MVAPKSSKHTLTTCWCCLPCPVGLGLVRAMCRVVGEQGESYWLYNVPWSIGRMLRYMKNRYDNPYIWVLENGISEKAEAKRAGASALQDDLRTDYFKGYITESCK